MHTRRLCPPHQHPVHTRSRLGLCAAIHHVYRLLRDGLLLVCWDHQHLLVDVVVLVVVVVLLWKLLGAID